MLDLLSVIYRSIIQTVSFCHFSYQTNLSTPHGDLNGVPEQYCLL